MRNARTATVVEIGLSIALAAVLGLLKITLPWNIAGGSVSLAMLPLFVLALRRGLGAGVVCGVLFGGVDYLMEPWFVHPVQVMLDYPVAYGLCGLAGLAPAMSRVSSDAVHAARAVTGCIIGGCGRFAAAFVSGMVFFGANAAPGQPVWLYSLAYNASYLLPSLIACAAAAAVVVPVLARTLPVPERVRPTAVAS